MKPYYLFIALLIGSLTLNSCATPNTVGGFYSKYKRKKGVRNVKVPGWLIWLGTGLAHDIVKDDDAKMALQIGKKVKKLRFMFAEEGNPIPAEDVQRFVKQIKSQSFEDLIYIRDEEMQLNFMVNDENDKLKDIVILGYDDSNFFFASVKSKIKYEDLVKVINHYIEKQQSAPPPEKPKKKKKKKKEKLPQA